MRDRGAQREWGDREGCGAEGIEGPQQDGSRKGHGVSKGQGGQWGLRDRGAEWHEGTERTGKAERELRDRGRVGQRAEMDGGGQWELRDGAEE